MGCQKTRQSQDETPCITVAQNLSWQTVSFKSYHQVTPTRLADYTIQFPAGYTGYGMSLTIEGFVFYKRNADTSVYFQYAYSPTGGYYVPFGTSTIQVPEPDTMTIATNAWITVLLDKKQTFCDSSRQQGILYYTNSYYNPLDVYNPKSYGRLFWRDSAGVLRQAMDVNFRTYQQPEVFDIIRTIKKN